MKLITCEELKEKLDRGDDFKLVMALGDWYFWAVPVHVISRDPELVEPFLEWGFTRGAIPSRAHLDRGMDHFRDWFIHAYSTGERGR